MFELHAWQPISAMLVSLAAIPLILLSRSRPNLREFWTLLAAITKFLIIISMLPAVWRGETLILRLIEIIPHLHLSFRVDTMGVFFALVASSLWLVTSFYSIGYMRGVQAMKQTRYFASFALCLSSTIGIALAGDLLTFLICYEVLTIATYPLVVHNETEQAIRSGRKYLVYTLSAGVLLILGVIWTYQLSGTLTFQAGGFLQSSLASTRELWWLFIIFISAAGVKAGLMPLHSWLPAAMVAPTPVSALLHAVAVVKAGVFAILRIVGFVFGPHLLEEIGAWNLLAWIAGLTLVIASLIAYRQEELKRRLAYSTIAHLSYIVLGAALLGSSAWQGSLLHLVNHATLKITLFFVAGAIYVQTRKQNISELNGIGRQMPITMGAFLLASLGLAGVPPISGFISKWYLATGSLEQNEPIFFVMLLLAGLLCGGYLIPIAFRAFFRTPTDGPKKFKEAPALMVVPLCITALISLVLGIFPNSLGHLFEMAGHVATSVAGVNL